MRLSTLLFAMLTVIAVHAQTVPVMETGGQVMPNEWIDKDTGHKVIKLTRREGLNASFYFHNNPFVGNEMLFCGGKMNFAGNDNLHGSGPKEGLQLYAVNLKTLAIRQLTNEPWLNHLQFSPTDPHLLMFCHEGPWHEVDRIWTFDVVKREPPRLIHKRTVYREIAGHEWWGPDGKHIYFDLQKPRGETFFVGKTNVYTGDETDYELQRDEWSVHFVTSWDQTFMAGDGGAKNSVAHSPNGQWIYRFDYNGPDKLKTRKLVNLKNHDYNLEPNIHFSPDDKWIIFRANFEGYENIYAVEL